MKILFVTEFFPEKNSLNFSGGVEAFSFNLVREIARRHYVVVICRKSDPAQPGREIFPGNLQIIRIGPAAKRIDTGFLTVPARLYFTLASVWVGLKESFDLVQGNNFVTYPAAAILGALRKKPAVAWYPDVFVGRWIGLTGLLSGLTGEISERLSLKFSWSKIVAMSGSTREKLIEQDIPEAKIATIYGGVDRELFKPGKNEQDENFYICCVTRLVGYKKVDLLIKAARILKEKGIDVRVEIMGEGPEKSKLVALAEKTGLKDKVRFHGRISQEQMVKVLQSSRLFCLPSEVEGFGLVTMEAASCGLPFVVTDIPVLKEVTENGLGGSFFKKGDATDLAYQIARYVKDPKLCREKSAQALQLSRKYSWDKIAADFEDMYREIASKPLRVLMLVDAWFPHVGGGQVHAWELSKDLARQGCRVTVFTRSLGEWSEEFPGVEVVRVGHFKKFANVFGRLEYLILALWFSLRTDYDILHAHAFSPGLLVPMIKFFRRKPFVFTVHGRGVKIAGIGTGESYLQNLIFYKIPYDLEITVAANTLTKQVAAKKLVVIPNGVDTVKFSPAIRERKEIRRILYVGRLSEEKGVDLLIEAFKKLHRLELKLDIVGDGAEAAKLKKAASGSKITFWGRLDGEKLLERFKKADLLVLPSRTEGQPVTLFEAWAAKLPVLATMVGDNEKYIKDGESGFLTNPDVQSIYQKLKEILQTAGVDRIAERGYHQVQSFSWDKVAEQTLSAYRKVLEENGKDR